MKNNIFNLQTNFHWFFSLRERFQSDFALNASWADGGRRRMDIFAAHSVFDHEVIKQRIPAQKPF